MRTPVFDPRDEARVPVRVSARAISKEAGSSCVSSRGNRSSWSMWPRWAMRPSPKRSRLGRCSRRRARSCLARSAAAISRADRGVEG